MGTLSRTTRKGLVQRGHPQASLSLRCRLLGLCRSSLYYRRREPDAEATGADAAHRRVVHFAESMEGFGVILFVMFGMLAIPLKSYWKPVIILSAVRFGMVGAICGHAILGMEVSFLSMCGMPCGRRARRASVRSC